MLASSQIQVQNVANNHLSAELKNGQPIEAEGRQTDLWQRHDGKWLIVHEHTSAPVSL
jgi:ketosteroid isomerase-like protein